MQGFAVIDSQPGSSIVAIWHTTRVGGATVEHTNAVALDLDCDPDALQKAHSLTRDRAVLLTEGSTADRLPVEGQTLTVQDLDRLRTATREHQERISAAVEDYIQRTKKRTIVRANFAQAETRPRGDSPDTPTDRALHAANDLAIAWRRWLATDDERRRRTADGNGTSPWMMPPELGATELVELPPEFAARINVQPVDAFNA